MSSPNKVKVSGGKAKLGSTSQYLCASTATNPFKFGLATAGSQEEKLSTSAREWLEWSELEGMTGARMRLVADEWEGASPKWTIRTLCE